MNFFAQLRLTGVMHLGQIQLKIIETNGSISLSYYADDEVKYGLPILPELFDQQSKEITKEDYYTCSFCGYLQKLKPVKEHICPTCNRNKWVTAMNKKRVS